MGKKSFYNNRRGYNPHEHRPKSIQKFKNKNEKPKVVDEEKKEDMLKMILQSKLSNNTVLTFQHKNKIKMTLIEGYQKFKLMIEKMSLNVRKLLVDAELQELYKNLNKVLPSKTEQCNQYLKALLIGNKLDDKSVEDTGRYISIDCEMVGYGAKGKNSVLGRVSMVNYYGHVILDTFVDPKVKVTDYRTFVSGIEPHHLENAPDINKVLDQVKEICKDKIIVGHSIKSDLKVLKLENHPYIQIRDTAKFKPLLLANFMKSPSLKTLAYNFLDLEIQTADHSSVEDAQATMALFRLFQGLWEDPQTGCIKNEFLPKSLQVKEKKEVVVEEIKLEVKEVKIDNKE